MQAEDLQEIWEAGEAHRDAQAHLRQVVGRHANRPHADITAIAEAAGVHRGTVYRWKAETDATDGDAGDGGRSAMDEALRLLLGLGIGSPHQLSTGLMARDLKAKARRLIRAPVETGELRQMAEEDRGVLAAGNLAAVAALGGREGRNVWTA